MLKGSLSLYLWALAQLLGRVIFSPRLKAGLQLLTGSDAIPISLPVPIGGQVPAAYWHGGALQGSGPLCCWQGRPADRCVCVCVCVCVCQLPVDPLRVFFSSPSLLACGIPLLTLSAHHSMQVRHMHTSPALGQAVRVGLATSACVGLSLAVYSPRCLTLSPV